MFLKLKQRQWQKKWHVQSTEIEILLRTRIRVECFLKVYKREQSCFQLKTLFLASKH